MSFGDAVAICGPCCCCCGATSPEWDAVTVGTATLADGVPSPTDCEPNTGGRLYVGTSTGEAVDAGGGDEEIEGGKNAVLCCFMDVMCSPTSSPSCARGFPATCTQCHK